MRFFAPPPPEIGPLRSAESTLGEGAVTLSTRGRAAVQVVGALVCAAIGWGFMAASGYSPWVGLTMLPSGAVLGWVVSRHVSTVNAEVTYVGDEGVAAYRTQGAPDAVQGGVLRFADAAHLRAERTAWAVPGGSSTATRLAWCAVDGRDLFSWSDTVIGAYEAIERDAPIVAVADHHRVAAVGAGHEHRRAPAARARAAHHGLAPVALAECAAARGASVAPHRVTHHAPPFVERFARGPS